jgi:hypothetical protein
MLIKSLSPMSSPVREAHFAEGVMPNTLEPTLAIKGDELRCNMGKREMIGNEGD